MSQSLKTLRHFLLTLPWLLAAAAAGAAGQEPGDAHPLPADAELVAAGARIGSIDVEIGNVFDENDPREDRRIFHWVNRLHRLTRPAIVHDRLLFAVGDTYDPARVAESERPLARRPLFLRRRDPAHRLRPGAQRGGGRGAGARRVDLKGGLKVGRSGGENSYGVGLQDDNFLGTGKSLQVERRHDVDRDSNVFHYIDPAIRGSRWRLGVDAENNSDGDVYGFDLELPFYSLDSRRAFGLKYHRESAAVQLYQLGEVADRFLRDRDHAELYFGLSSAAAASGSGAGWAASPSRTALRRRFRAARARARRSPAPSGRCRGPRRLIYPFVGLSTAADRFAKTHDFDQIARTEDLSSASRPSFRSATPAKPGARTATP